MKLYYSPGACSLAAHIVLRELQLPFEAIRIDNKTKLTADGGNFLDINPLGYVAALRLDDDQVLTEGPAILQYLADLQPQAGLAPANGTFARVRLQEWLSFITSELHAGTGPLFSTELPEALKAGFKARMLRRLDHTARALEASPYLLGEQFSVADACLFPVLRWMRFFDIDLQQWPALASFMDRVGSRPSVIEALAVEAATP
jgi:glutathione S-transferase